MILLVANRFILDDLVQNYTKLFVIKSFYALNLCFFFEKDCIQHIIPPPSETGAVEVGAMIRCNGLCVLELHTVVENHFEFCVFGVEIVGEALAVKFSPVFC